MMKYIVAIFILALLNAYVGWRVIARGAWAETHTPLLAGLTLLFFVLQLAGPFGDHMIFPKLKEDFGFSLSITVIDWFSYGALGLLSCLFIYSIAADAITILLKIIYLNGDPVRFDRRALLALSVVTAGTMVVGIKEAVAGPRIKRVDIPIRNLPKKFHGFKIAQISDLHVGPTIGEAYTANVVRMVNELQPDLVALTGDFVDGSVDQLRLSIAPLGDLKSVHGSYFITGNHEYYWGADEWVAEFKSLGATVLTNEHRIIKRDDQKIILAGVTDYSTLHMDHPDASSPKRSLEGAPPNLIKILLAHQPASYRLAQEAGFDLQLSGHTHAGQYFPFNIVVALVQRYYKGLNRHKDMWVYVSNGTGYWGPPLRGGVPSEVTLITLRNESVAL